MKTMYALVDCNSFYCSCERLFRPDLADKPVVVLSNNDGCIVARSKEAKELGVDMAAPFYKWRDFLDKNNASWFSSNYALYGDISNRIMSVLQQFCPSLEQYSIDEAFMDLRGMQISNEWIDNLHKTIQNWVGIPVSIGIGATKTLAKIANQHAKKTNQAGYILSEQIDEILEGLPLTTIWGVGRKSIQKLNRYGIWDALDLKRRDPLFMRKKFNIGLERTVRELNSEACLDFDTEIQKRKNIQVSRSFGTLISDYAELEQAVVAYTTRAAEKLREQNSLASAAYVYLRTNPHRKEDQYNNGAADGFIVPTAGTFEIVKSATKLLRKIYRKGYAYQKTGVLLLDLVDESAHTQQDMFGVTDEICRQKELMDTLDKINTQYGRTTVRLASQGFNNNKWKLRSKFRSPRYTTNWQELPKVL